MLQNFSKKLINLEKNELQSLSHAFRLLKTLCQHLFLRFNLEKHDSHCDFSFLTTVDLFYLLFWGF